MITILSRIFIRDREGEAKRKAYGTLCSIVGILLNILLFVGKYIAGGISGSVAIVADAFNNLSDAGSSFITLIGFLFAGKKPDHDHPFGHGRVEYVSGFIVSLVILLMGFELLKESVSKIFRPEPVETSIFAMGVLVVSVLVKLYMTFYNRVIGKRIESAAMLATSLDSLSDVVATLVVLISMLVMRYAGINVDGYCGVLVALFILYAGYSAARDTLNPLLGLAPDKELVKKIEQIVLEHEGVIGLHDLLVHDYGPGHRIVSLHAEVPGNRSIYEIHDIIDHIEREINEKLSCETVIHMDPVEPDNEAAEKLKKIVVDKVKQIDKRVTIHDFRLVTGANGKKLFFDAVVPYDIKMELPEIKSKIEQMIEELEGDYETVITIDQSS